MKARMDFLSPDQSNFVWTDLLRADYSKQVVMDPFRPDQSKRVLIDPIRSKRANDTALLLSRLGGYTVSTRWLSLSSAVRSLFSLLDKVPYLSLSLSLLKSMYLHVWISSCELEVFVCTERLSWAGHTVHGHQLHSQCSRTHTYTRTLTYTNLVLPKPLS